MEAWNTELGSFIVFLLRMYPTCALNSYQGDFQFLIFLIFFKILILIFLFFFGVRCDVSSQIANCASKYWQITGSYSSVRKALLSVSSCLRDNPMTEPANFSSARSFGSTTRGAGPPPTMDPYAQRNYLPSVHAPDYHFRNYSSTPGPDVSASAHRKILEEDVLFRMLCSNDKVGSLIGKGGVIIRTLQSETGASIKVVDAISDSDERIIVISAREVRASFFILPGCCTVRIY